MFIVFYDFLTTGYVNQPKRKRHADPQAFLMMASWFQEFHGGRKRRRKHTTRNGIIKSGDREKIAELHTVDGRNPASPGWLKPYK